MQEKKKNASVNKHLTWPLRDPKFNIRQQSTIIYLNLVNPVQDQIKICILSKL